MSPAHRPSLPPGDISVIHFLEVESTPGTQCGRKNLVIKSPNDSMGIRVHDLPACSAVPQPTAPPRVAGTNIFEENMWS